jgi:hypothetical protein
MDRGDGQPASSAGGVVDMLLDLQRTAGNAAVVHLLQRQTAEELMAAPAEMSPSDARAKQAEEEAEGPIELDELVPSGGGGYPVGVEGAAEPAGFHDDGRRGHVPFGDASAADEEADGSGVPHAFVAGGRSGSRAWAGGGGAGPKGNQETGSIQKQVVPTYDGEWGGVFSNANAWVTEGTGIADVTRDYVTSDAGDQGNGWYVTDKAADALDKHEQRHVNASKETYEAKIQPALDRVAKSADLGRDKTYWQRDAKTLLARQIGWERAMKDFVDQDQQYNANGGVVDTEDQGSPWYPAKYKDKKVNGKEYTGLLKLPGEPFPEE